MFQSIEQEWNEFAEAVMPSVPKDSAQYKEMRMSFFAGALVVYLAVIEMGGPAVSEEEGRQYLLSIGKELFNLKNEMRQEIAKLN